MKLKSLLICLVMLTMATSAFALDPTLTVGSPSYKANGTVAVPVILAANGAQIATLALELNYDPALLSNPVGVLGSATTGANKSLYARNDISSGTGKYRFIILGGTGPDAINNNATINTGGAISGDRSVLASGIIAVITFNVSSSATGTISLNNSFTDAAGPGVADPDPLKNYVPNKIVIAGSSATLNPGNQCVKASATNLTSVINVLLERVAFQPWMCADVNFSGSVTSQDLTLVINAILERITLL